MDLNDRIYGCMIGGAVGDALGYPVEFMDGPSIRRKYGERGVREYELNDKGVAEISDDTQMSLYTANGVLLGLYRGHYRGVMGRPDMYCVHSYLDWLTTQQRAEPDMDKSEKCWLNKVPGMYARRAPGITCLSALESIASGREVVNNSCGCGGVMRVAPWALIAVKRGYNEQQSALVDLVGAEMAKITHKHPLGFLPSAVLTHIICKILTDDVSTRDDLVAVIEDAMDTLPGIYDEEQGTVYGEEYGANIIKLRRILTDAIERSMAEGPDYVQIEQMAQGWTGHEALAIALFCCLRHIDSFEDAVSASVSHAGDSDSTGAICGNIMGAILGVNAIPAKFKERLELIDVIEEMSEDICTGIVDCYYDESKREVATRQQNKYELGLWPAK